MFFSKDQCPRCRGLVERIKRRPFDHTISRVIPMKRMVCVDRGCNWEGLVPMAWEPIRVSPKASLLTIAAIAIGVVLTLNVTAYMGTASNLPTSSRAR